MSRHRIGSRNRSIHASQYRVGRYGRTLAAASSVTSTWLAMSAASAPSVAPSGESVTVDRNSAMAPTPSIDTPMYPTVAAILTASWVPVSVVPDTVTAAAGWESKSDTPTT